MTRSAIMLNACLLAVLMGCHHVVTPGTTEITALSRQQVHIAFDNPSDVLRFDLTDPSVFRYTSNPAYGGALELSGAAKYDPPYRSPLALAILREPIFSDFEMVCAVYQTGREYAHRDLCFVFGYQDPSHYYYAHLASKGDANAHHIMIVDGADRRPVTSARSTGVGWGRPVDPHQIRIVRKGANIRVYFDDSDQPVLEANDTTFPSGRFGFGSFDDTGAFAHIKIQGESVSD